MDRTEEQKVVRAPIVVVFDGKEYEIPPLVIRDSRKWRTKVIGLIAQLPQLVKTTMDDSGDFGEALNQMMVVMPNKVIDLFFEYATNLDRDEMEGIATDEEMATAFEEVIKVAFPLAKSLPEVMGRLSQ